ncbi:hypothetical protein SCUP234_00375 [Seiridium cupressi]
MKSITFFAAAATLFTAISGTSIPVEDRDVAQPAIHAFWENDVAFFGEAPNENRSEKRCTHCVGNHEVEKEIDKAPSQVSAPSEKATATPLMAATSAAAAPLAKPDVRTLQQSLANATEKDS